MSCYGCKVKVSSGDTRFASQLSPEIKSILDDFAHCQDAEHETILSVSSEGDASIHVFFETEAERDSFLSKMGDLISVQDKPEGTTILSHKVAPDLSETEVTI